MKEYRKKELVAYVVGNALLILMITGAFDDFYLADSKGVSIIVRVLLESVLPVTVLYTYVLIADSIVPSKIKDAIVYLPCGAPGSRIFSIIRNKKGDKRFSSEEARNQYSDIYKKIDEIGEKTNQSKEIQNTEWYAIYRQHADEGSICTAQQDFLMVRDMSSMTILIILLYLFISLSTDYLLFSCKMIVTLLSEFLITWIAAKSKAMTFALNVIANDIHHPRKSKTVD